MSFSYLIKTADECVFRLKIHKGFTFPDPHFTLSLIMNSQDLLDNTNTQALPGEREGRMSRVNLFYTGGGGEFTSSLFTSSSARMVERVKPSERPKECVTSDTKY